MDHNSVSLNKQAEKDFVDIVSNLDKGKNECIVSGGSLARTVLTDPSVRLEVKIQLAAYEILKNHPKLGWTGAFLSPDDGRGINHPLKLVRLASKSL